MLYYNILINHLSKIAKSFKPFLSEIAKCFLLFLSEIAKCF